MHKLRHANATLLINNGVPLKIVSETLGHSDIQTTANIYSEVLESRKKYVASVIDQAWKWCLFDVLWCLMLLNDIKWYDIVN